MIRFALFAAVASLCVSTLALAQPAEQPVPGAEQTPAEAFRDALSPFIGTWETSIERYGRPSKGRITYVWDPSENVVLAHMQSEARDESWQSVGLTMYAPSQEVNKIFARTFVGDGVDRSGTAYIGESESGNLMISTIWATDDMEVRLEYEVLSSTLMVSRQSVRPDDEDAPWGDSSETKWERVTQTEPTLAAPDAASESEKTIVRTATVKATPAEVWRAWTTSEGITEWWVEEANIELKIGGKFELYMLPATENNSGNRGSEGCTILAYAPERMLAATWNAPPSFPEQRFQHTRITLLLEPVDDGHTKVTLIHSGWPDAEMTDESGGWPKVFRYFDAAWSFVFDRMTVHFSD